MVIMNQRKKQYRDSQIKVLKQSKVPPKGEENLRDTPRITGTRKA
jgi:hypothetical protein